MNNEEPTLTALANVQIGEPSRKMPEQTVAQIPVSIPRPISFLSVIHQWQPMGIRVVVDLPFVGDDMSTLFCIRNGPYIPDHREKIFSQHYGGSGQEDISVFAFNATNAVIMTTDGSKNIYPKNYPVHISYYDSPPLLSQISRCFRRWRGDMQYRIRVVAGFVTQGYLLISPIKNTPVEAAQLDEYKQFYFLRNTDTTSYRPMMQNSYLMSDTSMYRHVEVTYPYEYPTPWYDQFQWLANRWSPQVSFDSNKKFVIYPTAFEEPFADNWLSVLVRGVLEPTRNTSQMTFELEYRAMEGFQFADANLPPSNIHKIRNKLPNSIHSWAAVKTIPSSSWTSDGISLVSAVSQQTAAQSVVNYLSVPKVPKNLEYVGPGNSGVPAQNSKQVRSGQVRSRRVERVADENEHPKHVDEYGSDEYYNSTEPPVESSSGVYDTVDSRTPSQRRRDLEFSY